MTTANNNQHQLLNELLSQERLMNMREKSSFEKLDFLLKNLMTSKTVSQKGRNCVYFWDEAHFGLDKVGAFQALPQEAKTIVLKLLTDHNLNESHYIEKAGMSYAGKMILLSESENEKALYCSIANDEATHLHDIKNFLSSGVEETYRGNSFLKFIAHVIQNGSPKACQTILQVGLEGYGMGYYQWLKNACLDQEFKNVLSKIIVDEAGHHGSGVIIASQSEFTSTELQEVEAYYKELVTFMNCSLFPVALILEKVSGGFTSEQRMRMFSELNASQVNAEKVKAIIKLLTVAKLSEKVSTNLVQELSQSWNEQTTTLVYTQMLSGA